MDIEQKFETLNLCETNFVDFNLEDDFSEAPEFKEITELRRDDSDGYRSDLKDVELPSTGGDSMEEIIQVTQEDLQDNLLVANLDEVQNFDVMNFEIPSQPELEMEKKKKGFTQKKGEYSQNYLRDDKVVKALLRSLKHLNKVHFDKLVKDHKKETGQDLKKDSKALFLWLCEYLESYKDTFRDLFHITLNDSLILELFSMVAYLLRVKTFEAYIKKGFPANEAREIIKLAEKYRRYNHPTHGTSMARCYAMGHCLTRFGCILFRTDASLEDEFWNKLLNRKGTTFADVQLYKERILSKLETIS